MILEEIMPMGWPDNERPLPAAARERCIRERNDANLLRWHLTQFGPVAGQALYDEHQRRIS